PAQSGAGAGATGQGGTATAGVPGVAGTTNGGAPFAGSGGGGGAGRGGGGAMNGGEGGAGEGGGEMAGEGGTHAEPPACDPLLTPALDGPPAVEAGEGPLAAAVADFDADGRLDLATADNAGNTVTVLLGNGDASFRRAFQIDVGQAPGAIVALDWNRDGAVDLVTGNDGSVSILLGRNDGSFDSSLDFGLSGRAHGIVGGDFDADGAPDLGVAVTLPAGSGIQSVLFGSGGGSIVEVVDFFEMVPVGSVAAGDVNADGRTDLVFQASLQSSALIGGTRNFVPRRSETDVGAIAALDDLDGDGWADLALVMGCPRGVNSSLKVLRGSGDGYFAERSEYPSARCMGPAAAGDVDGNGTSDIVGAPNDVWLGNGDGSFREVLSAVTLGGRVLGLGDFDRDGRLDVAVAAEDSVFVRPGNGDGTFGSTPEFPTASSLSSLVLVDLNGDGVHDVAGANAWPAPPESSSASVLLGAGEGRFGSAHAYPTGVQPKDLAVRDLNYDGRGDLVTANDIDGTLSVLLGLGDGSFAPKQDYAVGGEPVSVAIGDANGDGSVDIVCANRAAHAVTVLAGRGDGSFSSPVTWPAGGAPWTATLADVNGDGRLDVVTANYEVSTISVLLGLGGGSFAAPRDYATGRVPTALAAGDLDGDGRMDLLTGNDATFSLLLGAPGGEFPSHEDFAGWASDLAVVDLNQDGILDVVANGPALRLYLGAGDGSFLCEQDYVLGGGLGAFDVADVNGDGRWDVVAATSESIAVFLGAPR
ncbi:MAG TPA: VCBS repeat-containing protein, partial [Polyangiaceae bacterium]